MLGNLRHLIRWLLICTAIPLCAVSNYLKPNDIMPTMDKLFTYHVENKEFTPKITVRVTKLYLQQFDRSKSYLLEDEFNLFLDLNQNQTKQITLAFQNGDFAHFKKLNGLAQKAIMRHREIRQELMEQFSYQEEEIKHIRKISYPKNEEMLSAKIQNEMQRVVYRYVKLRGLKEISSEESLKMLQFWDQKKQKHEEAYLHVNKKLEGHYLTLHTLKAFAKSLDAHTGYYSPEEAIEIRTSLKKEYKGIGVVLQEEYDGIYISDLVLGGPAHRSKKIKKGDKLSELNGKSVEILSYEEILNILGGSSGDDIKLQFKRDQTKIGPLLLKREKIVMDNERLHYTFEPYGEGIIGKIVLPGFYDNGSTVTSEKDLREALRDLKERGNLLGLVIDIRENSGGFLSQAVKVAGLFMTQGVVVISKYANGEMKYLRKLDGRHYYQGPLILLSSKASASAAEIVAQALQDYGIALIAGDERTYGKGSMQYQTLTDPAATSFYKVTVGRYYTISGRSTQIEGVQADIIIPTAFSPYRIGERYLEFPLQGDHISSQYKEIMALEKSQNVVPYLQKRETKWRKMLPTLNQNSTERLKNNENFKFYLKVINREASLKNKRNFGVTDLQMEESIKIIKDMISIGN